MRSLLEISKSGLRSAERSISVTANNLINADTPGYTRQRVEKIPVGMQMSGKHTGLGVDITGLKRMRNEMNDVLMNEKQQNMSFMQNKARIFEQLEAVMATDSGNDLDLSISNLFDGFSELASNPQDMSIRNSLITDAQQMTQKFNDLDRSLNRISELTLDSANKSLKSVNGLLKEIHALNQNIQQGQAAGQPDNVSLDMRVARLEELSEMINFESQVVETGAVHLRVGGVTVLDADKAHTIKPEINDIERSFILRIESGKTINVTGGRLGAELEMYQNEIPAIDEKLDNLAATIVEEVNAILANGYNLDGVQNPLYANFFASTGTSAEGITLNQNLVENPENIQASDTANEAGNGEIAAQIAELRNGKLIGNQKFVDYAVGLISNPGTNLKSLDSQIVARDSELQMLKTQQEREAGVNIDEELSMMIQYQNAYQGAAKVMAAAQNMYDTLIGIVR